MKSEPPWARKSFQVRGMIRRDAGTINKPDSHVTPFFGRPSPLYFIRYWHALTIILFTSVYFRDCIFPFHDNYFMGRR